MGSRTKKVRRKALQGYHPPDTAKTKKKNIPQITILHGEKRKKKRGQLVR